MIDLALDPSDTRPHRSPEVRAGRKPSLRLVVVGLAGAGAIAGFGVAASSFMAELAAPAPVKRASLSRAADWPELKDGLPAVAGVAAAAPKPAEPEKPALRMAAMADPVVAVSAPAVSSPVVPVPAKVAVTPVTPAKSVAAPEAPTKRIPTPTPVTPIAARQVVAPLPPARTAALQPPRASETVRAREFVEPAAVPAPKPVAAAPAKPAAVQSEKPAAKAVAAHKPLNAPKTASSTKSGTAPTAVAQAEAADEETEVLGIKLPSLAPAGRKLKESVDALGDAVKSVF